MWGWQQLLCVHLWCSSMHGPQGRHQPAARPQQLHKAPWQLCQGGTHVDGIKAIAALQLRGVCSQQQVTSIAGSGQPPFRGSLCDAMKCLALASGCRHHTKAVQGNCMHPKSWLLTTEGCNLSATTPAMTLHTRTSTVLPREGRLACMAARARSTSFGCFSSASTCPWGPDSWARQAAM